MAERWFRVYESLVDDPKVQRLPDRLFKALVNLWCLASANRGILPDLDTMAFKLRMKPVAVYKVLGELRVAGLLDDEEGGTGVVRPHNWDGRQFQSDSSTKRVREFRERQRNGDGNAGRNGDETLHGTPPETETEQKKPSLRSGAKKATRLADDWLPSETDRAFAKEAGLSDSVIDQEAARFRDFWLAKPGRDGTKLDWSATWRNWIRRACETRGIGPPANGNGAQNLTDDDWRKRLDWARERSAWPAKWGPPPGHLGCTVPAGLIRDGDGSGWREWTGEH